MSTNSSAQPAAKPPMSTSHNGAAHPSSAAAGEHAKPKPSLIHEASEKFVDKAAEDSADKVVDYLTEDPKQTLQDAEDEAKGLFNKYCACFAS